MPEPHQRPPIADADLLRRVILRDSTALIELERRHRPSLYAQAYGVLMDSALAERVAGEVFAQLWYAAGRFVTKQRNLWGWLRELVKSIARAELMLQEPRYSQYSASQRSIREAHTVVHSGTLARTHVGGGTEPPERQTRPSRDACSW